MFTSIELLSPTNKIAPGRGDYCAKRAALLRGTASLVEIDLPLAGRRQPGDSCPLVSRVDRQPACDVYAWSLRRSLPRLPIPLPYDDANATLDSATADASTYDDGPYDLVLPCDRPPPGPLSEADQAWVAERALAGVPAGDAG